MKSRTEVTVFDQFCFREGLKTWTQFGIQDGFWSFLYSKCKRIFRRFALPFAALWGLCERKCRWGGHAEFLARRQEEYQRTLCDLWVMYGRVTKSAQENQLTQDFGTFNAANGLQITITCKTLQWLSLSRHYRRVKYYAEFTVIYSLKVR